MGWTKRWTRRWIARLRTVLNRTGVERELDEELAFHLDMEVRKLERAGHTPEEARRRAMIAFGGLSKYREGVRDRRALGWVSGLGLDARLGVRMLARFPGLALVGVAGLAGAIAIGVGLMSFFESYMFSPLPFEEGDRIIAVENWDVESGNESRRSIHDFELWRERLTTVDNLSAFRTTSRNLVLQDGAPQLAALAEMTASGFRVTGVSALLGRALTEEDEAPGASPVLVIGHEEWQRRFDGDPEILGEMVRVGNVVHRIVGVMPSGFGFPVNHEYWIPWSLRATDYPPGEGPPIFVFGRLAEGVPAEAAQAQLTAIGQRAAADSPATHARLRPTILPYAYPLLDIQGMTGWEFRLLQLVGVFLLVVVAVNVGVLVYARTAMRRGEIVVRTALGATRRRIVTQLFVEALVLSTLATVVGLMVLRLGFREAEEAIGTPFFWIEYGTSPATLAVVLVLTILAAVIVGVVPALQATGPRMQSTLRSIGGGSSPPMGKSWTMLIVVQVLIAMAALPIAILLGWNVVGEVVLTPRFDSDRFLLVGIQADSIGPTGVGADAFRESAAERFPELQREVVRLLEAEPGVGAVTFADNIPDRYSTVRIDIPGTASSDPVVQKEVGRARVDIDFFAALGIPLLAGRMLVSGDLESGSTAVVVNRAFAERVLGGDALGRRIRPVGGPEDVAPDRGVSAPAPIAYEVVGVVEDLSTRRLMPEEVRPALFLPLALGPEPVSLAIRGDAVTPERLAERVREIAAQLDPSLRLRTTLLESVYRDIDVGIRLVARMLAVMMGSVLLLSAGGIYALMSFVVTRRQREIGIRVALGAPRGRLLGSIFSTAFRQLAGGVLLGSLLAVGLARALGSELTGTHIAWVLPAMAAIMVLVGALATLGPARRGLSVEPMRALKEG